MFKKILSLTLALGLLCGTLVACGNQTQPDETQKPTLSPEDDPFQDDTLNILMVGNSFCFYYVEELYGLLMANPDTNKGYTNVQIYNLYYSGCNLTQHHGWWSTNKGEYQLYKTDATGRNDLQPSKQWTLENALKQAKWDYISLQGTIATGNYSKDDSVQLATSIMELAGPMLDRFHELHPGAQLLWHRTWPFEIGRISGSTVYTEEMLENYDAGMQRVCDHICNELDKDKDYDLVMVNSGAAWVEARTQDAKRETTLFPDGGLCARLGVSNAKTYTGAQKGQPDVGDGYHDGDIGGGQFLNACVWYETITGQSCLDNPYKPDLTNGKYQLSDELVSLLRNAAHTTVQNAK